tara:strand:- start:201 stop:362 length:162 start_codon:yes stop_codon:yes gene_type:complete
MNFSLEGFTCGASTTGVLCSAFHLSSLSEMKAGSPARPRSATSVSIAFTSVKY